MKKFIIKANRILGKDIQGYNNCEYVGYQQKGNPDFINRLKNTANTHNELDLIQDFIDVAERARKDLETIVSENNMVNPIICILPRSKAEKTYTQSQMMFQKAISCIIKKLNVIDGSSFIQRVKDTKTTHNWRVERNYGDMPYKGIAKDTCIFKKDQFKHRDIIVVDDVYTKNVNVAEDFIQTILDFGAKSVTLYVIAKTRD